MLLLGCTLHATLNALFYYKADMCKRMPVIDRSDRINLWNSWPQVLVIAPGLDAFKRVRTEKQETNLIKINK